MPTNWKAEIVQMVRWKEVIAQHDALRAYPWHFPKIAATSNEVSRVEALLGKRFSLEFQEFLTYANGWKGFFILVDLFGTDDFLKGRSTEVLKRPEVMNFVLESGWSVLDVTPIGASDLEVDVYLHISPISPVFPGGVIWWAKEEIERFSSFHEFLSEMINYNARLAKDLSKRTGNGEDTETSSG